MAEEEMTTELMGGPVWVMLDRHVVDAAAVKAVEERVVYVGSLKRTVRDSIIHLDGTTLVVQMEPELAWAIIRTALSEQRLQVPAAESGVDPEVLESLTSMWRQDDSARAQVSNRWPPLAHRLDQMAGLSPVEGIRDQRPADDTPQD